MKHVIIICCSVLFAFSALGAPPSISQNHTDNVTLVMDSAPLSDIIAMLQRLTGASFVYTAKDIPSRAYASLDIKNSLWRPVLNVVLERHGLVLSSVSGATNTFTISKVDSEATAVRYRAAEEVVATIDTVLSALDKGDVSGARELLADFRKQNAELIKSTLEPKEKRTANKQGESEK